MFWTILEVLGGLIEALGEYAQRIARYHETKGTPSWIPTIGIIVLLVLYFSLRHRNQTAETPQKTKAPEVATTPEQPQPGNTTQPNLPVITSEGQLTIRNDRYGYPEVADKTMPPKMPMTPTGKGTLDGFTVVIDPGHGGTDGGSTFEYKGIAYREAAYTYKAAYELGEMLRQRGATIYYTAWSRAMEGRLPNLAMLRLPKPSDARFIDTKRIPDGNASSLRNRAKYANWVYTQHPGNKTLFISLHTDAEAPGLSGTFACVQQHTKVPRIAELIAAGLDAKGYGRKKNGKPVPSIKPHNLQVLRDGITPERILLEMATTTTPSDSYRIRSTPNRQKLLSIVVAAFERYAAEVQ